jgi:exodeoxyribonuclease VII large subunit
MTGNFAKKTLTVGELNRYIKSLITSDDRLSALWLQGEISNLKYHSSGHVYFSLKDEEGAVVKCVMFRSRSMYLKFRLEDGMKVVAFGSIDVFEQGGQYQFYAEKIEPDGLGALYAAFERLKKKLSEEGLFDEQRKKKLPLLPKMK